MYAAYSRQNQAGRAVRHTPSSRRTCVRTTALFSLFKPSEPSNGKLVERLAYRPTEQLELAPGVKTSPIGLGTWAWGNQFLWGYDEQQDPELQQVYNYVVSQGINFFDTADSYGTGRLNGKSEQLLGEFGAAYPGSERVRSGVHIATKLAPYPWRVLPSSMVDACKASMKRLRTDQITLGQLHWSAANYAPLQELGIRAGLGDLYDQGLVKCVGVSNYGPRQLKRLHKYLDNRGVPLASMQIQYSLLSCGPLQQEAKTVCDDLGIVLIAYSPLALGLLSGKYNADRVPEGPRGVLFRELLPEATPLLEVLAYIAQERRKTVPQVAINWCMGQGTVPIPGARTMSQAREVVGALGWRLSAGEQLELTTMAARIKRTMVQNVFQTQ